MYVVLGNMRLVVSVVLFLNRFMVGLGVVLVVEVS